MNNTLFGTLQLAVNSSFNLLFPALCPACNAPLASSKILMCLQCELDLPRTNHFEERDNIFFSNFKGDATIKSASALFLFARKSKVQRLIHQFKYQNKPELAKSLGILLGNEIKKCAHLQNIKALVPVPMHVNKLRQRGYNQSDIIAQGIAEVLNLPIETNLIQKTTETESQTHRSRTERKDNLSFTFESTPKKYLENAEVLLIDDVSTSGATLEAVVDSILLKNPTIIFHCATLAFAQI